MDNREIILKEIDKHKGELVLDVMELVMLIGFHEDDEDYYYEYLKQDGTTIYSSCVGSFISLKNSLPHKVYNHLCDLFYINVIQIRQEFWNELEEWMTKSMGRKPTSPIWG